MPLRHINVSSVWTATTWESAARLRGGRPTKVEEADAAAGAEGARLEQAQRDQGVWHEARPGLPEQEQNQSHEAADNEADDHGRLPASRGDGDNSEGDEDHAERGAEEDHAQQVKVDPDGAQDCAEAELAVVSRGEGASLLCAAAVEEQREGERQESDGQDDSPHAVSPAPGRREPDGGAYEGPDPDGDEEGGVGQAGEEGAVGHVAGVCNEDLLEGSKALGAGRVEDLGRGKGLDVVGGGHLDVSEGVEQDAEGKGLEAAKDVGDLGHGRLDDGIDDALDGVDGRDERVLAERGRGKGNDRVGDLALERRGKGHEEDAEVGSNEAPFGPGHRDGLDGLDAVLAGYLGVARGPPLEAVDIGIGIAGPAGAGRLAGHDPV